MAEDTAKVERVAPRERILVAAGELFYRHGIRAVGVEAVAEAAGTNKMTLYRHFTSKDELVAEYLRRAAAESDTRWARYEREHPGAPFEQLRAWLRQMAEHATCVDQRGCALANAAVELADPAHPARPVIEAYKVAQNARLVALCQAAGLHEPELLADALGLLLEGARVTAQSVGREGLGERLVRIGEGLFERHRPAQ
ncbi:TetR/AcrR family transcriptional regulator [Melittangium boletus]|uniref:TetR/AcrR family transcriptional regulator n=1 Tax=Melittangium boletus TaxID=83453 RepID=UPI003DA35CA2